MPPPDGFANPLDVLADAAAGFLPPDRVSVADWAARSRYVTGAHAGRWNHDRAPYLTEPMLALTDPEVSDVVVPKPAQCGGTLIAENWLGCSIETDPADFGWYLNTDDVLKAYVKDRINIGLVEMHPALKRRLGHGDTDNSLSFKRFDGMVAHFLPATRSSLVNKTFARIVADEYDNYSDDFGDPKTQFDVRRQTYGKAGKMLALSHPDQAEGISPTGWTKGIMGLYARSTRCTWWWKCPHCNRTSSPNPGTSRQMVLDYPIDAPLDEIAAQACLLCPFEDCDDRRILDHERSAMNRTGVWLGRGQDIEDDGTITGARTPNPIAGFWIVGVMSPFLINGIGGLARDYAAALRDFTNAEPDAEKTLREVMSKKLGMPLVRPRGVDTVDAATLADRATDALRLGYVPEGVRYLTTAIDVQGNRFERLTRGWGPGMESWVIARKVTPAEPATDPRCWDALLTEALAETFPLADGSGRVMKVRAIGFDSFGLPGVTEQAYAAWKRAHLARQTRFFGKSGGREVWNLTPLKGASSPNANRLTVTRADAVRQDRRAARRGEIPLGVFNANAWKDALAGQLGRADPGPPAVHFPAALRSAAPPHAFFEQLTAETRLPTGAWQETGPRNEALDLMVMAHVVAHLHASRVNWRAPPAWCAPWDVNSLVALPQMPPPSVDQPGSAAPSPLQGQVPAGIIANTAAIRARVAALA